MSVEGLDKLHWAWFSNCIKVVDTAGMMLVWHSFRSACYQSADFGTTGTADMKQVVQQYRKSRFWA
jgi:uncharacterized membrane protein YjgN (DUF898 family)